MSESLRLDTSPTYARPSFTTDFLRKRLHAKLAKLQSGGITLIERGESHHFGDRSAPLQARVFVDDPCFYRLLAFGGPLGGSEAYMDGYWHSDDLTRVIRVLAANRDTLGSLSRGLSMLRRPALTALKWLRRNTRDGSKRNIAAHYDLGNEFFELVLDPTMTYSSGIFERAEASMAEASFAKYERICQKLRIGPDDHVLEIGTGWGGFALHAAARHGCKVTTTTISRRQHEMACERVRKSGLGDRVEVLFKDYRDLEGKYDKLVSIEMIEAVGHEHLPAFFDVCSERLNDDGVMLIQAITIPDRDFAAHTQKVDFIKRYIFPGGELVSLGATSAAASESNLRTVHVEDLTPHYAETLRRWRGRSHANQRRMRELGMDDRFLRMWNFYLCYCEGGFEERSIGLVQAVFEKSGARCESLLGRLPSQANEAVHRIAPAAIPIRPHETHSPMAASR